MPPELEAEHTSLTAEIVQQALQVRPGQLKRFLVTPREGNDEVTVA